MNPDRPAIFSLSSLEALLESTDLDDHRLAALAVPSAAEQRVARIGLKNAVNFVPAEGGANLRRVVFMPAALESLPQSADVTRQALQRAHRFAQFAGYRSMGLPPAWSSYHYDNLVAFFATTRELGAWRWVAEIRPNDSDDVVFWRLTDPSQPVQLQGFRPPVNAYESAVRSWGEACTRARALFSQRRRDVIEEVTDTVDLEAVTYGAVTGHRTYSMWLEYLTSDQRRFLEVPSGGATKLQGPAGSGKTLLLELKLLRELYAAVDAGRGLRVLFATHSWAVADQVDAALRALDDRAVLKDVDVYPLVSIAEYMLPSERRGGVELLGDDNLSGKREELRLLNAVVDDAMRGDWLVYKGTCSPALAERIEAGEGSPDRNALVWDLLLEFSCVLSAHGILPGVNARKQYLNLYRMPWMMPLTTEGDKLLVLRLYSEFVRKVQDLGLLTSDQLINDFLNYLVTFTWNLRRATEGYDLICVDELHLFNEQERLAVHYLTRDPSEYPFMLMALDPRQAPSEVYVPGGVGKVYARESGLADDDLGDVKSIQLDTVYRYSRAILELVKHINSSFPALELGEEWSMPLMLRSAHVEEGALPTLTVHDSREDEYAAVRKEALVSREGLAAGRVAVIVLDADMLDAILTSFGDAGGIIAIRGRDDVDALQYSKRSVVVGPAEYLAGMQFGRVIVCGFPPFADRIAHQGYQIRRQLSLLYLAVTRAEHIVSMHTNVADGGVSEVLESARQHDLIRIN
jgi:hypothetical protein